MRRFLVVGCGGSGGKTLAYMMDQLRSDLARNGVDGLPPGWQFVFLDVPTGIDRGPEGLGNVVQQGGRYLGLGPQGGSYADLDDALSQRLTPNNGLAALATWAPRRPQQEVTPIDVGAGQYRAIGRAILLAKAAEVKATLQDAWLTLVHAETTAAMERVARRTGAAFDVSKPPIVLVMSSMAGGSGASMALDVCRLLTLVPNINPNLIALFMLTPDVFDNLPPTARSGVRANALAMLGEIVASQTGAARRHDAELLGALGQRDASTSAVPFARVFPVGRSVGVERAQFGDGSPEAIFRGLARGLAGLMTSDVASDQFVDFDLGNKGSVPAVPKYLGWGAEAAPLPWGSYGFASISMGRDRYAEYAAQRIARACVDRLLDGHLQPGSEASGNEQAQSLLSSQWNAICRLLEVPPALAGPNAVADRDHWFRSVAFPAPQVEATAAQIADAAFRFERPDSDHWLEHVRRGMQAGRPYAVQQADEAAYKLAVHWQFSLQSRLEEVVAQSIARFGLSYAAAVLERLAAYVTTTLMPAIAGIGASQPGDPAELPGEVVSAASAKGAVRGNDQFFRTVMDSARLRLTQHIYIVTARHVGASLREFVTGVIGPLRAAVSEAYAIADHARKAQVTHDGLARLETDQYAAWPSRSDVRVPDRFGEANNELMLTPSSEFADQYAADIRTALDADEAGVNPEAGAVYQVILGQWRTVGGQRPPGGLVTTSYRWWPREFTTDPVTGDTVRAQEARYDVGARPGQIRSRAKAFVERPERSFANFRKVTMRDYVAADDVSDIERERRRADVLGKFRQALSMAIPLISVDAQAVRVLHRSQQGGQEVQYRYKFSAIPYQNLAVADELRGVLVNNRTIDASSRANFDQALTDTANPHRIDIFGSYPLYSPLSFDSILDPVVDQWDGTPPEGTREFWNLRRARPLDASLPMADVERRAMVAGWYVGQIVGEIVIPDEPYTTPVQIWDPQERVWVPFPYPMLTPPREFRGSFEWLPAVLESILIAMARVHQTPVMGSLRPYHLLRELYDSDELGGREGESMLRRAAERRFAAWLQRGSQSGRPSRIATIAEATTPDERYNAAVEWLTGKTGPAFLAREYFLPATYGGSGTGPFSEIKSRKQAGQTPFFRDLAPDIVWATGELEALLVKANRTRRPEPDEPDEPGPVLPDFGPL